MRLPVMFHRLISYSVNLMFVIVPLNAVSHVIPFVFLPGKKKAQRRSHSHWFIKSDTKAYLLNSYTEFHLLVDNRAVTFFFFFTSICQNEIKSKAFSTISRASVSTAAIKESMIFLHDLHS